VVAFGIYRVRKWGWFLFITFSALLIAYNLIVYFFLNPNYTPETILLFVMIITVFSAVFLRKHVYAPYFNPRLRWWETASRYRVTLDTVILTNDGMTRCKLLDLSQTGCFVDHSAELQEGKTVLLKMRCKGIDIHCEGKVVRKSGEKERFSGYGVMFQNVPKDTRKKIKHLIRALERLEFEDRKDLILPRDIPENFIKNNVLNQLGFKVKSSLKHVFHFA
jgi:hypothetical protein